MRRGRTTVKFVGVLDLSSSTVAVNLYHAAAGQELQYAISVGNTGSVVAPSVVVTDVIPLNSSLVAGSIVKSQGTVVDDNPIVVQLGDVPVDSTATITFRVLLGDVAACWFAADRATISSGAQVIERQVVTTVNTCRSAYLPLVVR